MPKFGEENLRCHLASTGCGAAEWAKKLTSVLEVERPQADDQRQVKVTDDGTVIDTKTKMIWHFETAKMSSSIGYLRTARGTARNARPGTPPPRGSSRRSRPRDHAKARADSYHSKYY